jgi:glycosyltransferase involved in cell wall biosynthesis
MDVSLIIVGSKERNLIFHTIKSAISSIEFAEKYDANIKTEIIIVLYDHDLETWEIVNELCKSRYKHRNATLYKTDCCDQWESRNFAVEKSNGKYITFLNAGDLVSEKWVYNALHTAKTAEIQNNCAEYVVHPNFEICLAKSKKISFCYQFCVNDKNANIAMLSGDCFLAPCFASKNIFLKYPYSCFEKIKKYKNLEQVFNFETFHSGCVHIPCDDTIYFANEFANDAQGDGIAKNCNTLDSGCLFHHYSKTILYKILSIPVLRRLSFFFRKLINMQIFWRISPKPDWFKREIIKMNSIDSSIRYSSYRFSIPKSYAYENCDILESDSLLNMLHRYDKKTDFCIFMPGVGFGGAERVAVTYANEISKSKKVTIFTSERRKHEGRFLVNEDVDIIDLENILCCLSENQKAKVVTQFLEYVRPGGIYFYDELFFSVLSKYGEIISGFAKIYLNIFSLYFNKSTGETTCFTSRFLKNVNQYITKIITDNQYITNVLMEKFNLKREKFECNYSFVNSRLISEYENSTKKLPTEHSCSYHPVPNFCHDGELNIFWASRVCKEKRVDILYEILKKSEALHVKFHIFGHGSNQYLKKIKKLNNVLYYGGYLSFDKIVNEDFDAFLYTSENDGIPNVLLEALSFGYPTIAPNICGIGELVIDNRNGFLIENSTDSDSYVKIIKNIIDDRNILKNIQKNIPKTLSEKFTKERFISVAKKIEMM